MKTINLTKKQFESLEQYKIPDYVCSTEGVLYILPTKKGWNKETKLLKKLYLNSGPQFGNKLWTINSLIDLKDEIDIEEIVYPEEIATVVHEIVGFTIQLIESLNLKTVLMDKKVDPEYQIDCLRQIGVILEKMRKVREYTSIKDFFINDLHESNFIVDKDGNVRLVDMDSCKINGNQIFSSKYLSTGRFINEVYKYQKDETKESKYKYQKYHYSPLSYFVPDENTDLYCYIIVILNYIYGKNVANFTLEEFFEYIEYLKKCGLSRELVDIFEGVAFSAPNRNPYELLEALKPVIGKGSHYVYSRVKK